MRRNKNVAPVVFDDTANDFLKTIAAEVRSRVNNCDKGKVVISGRKT